MGAWGKQEHTAGPTTKDRVAHAAIAISAHTHASGVDAGELPDQVVHLLSDLMHLSFAARCDFSLLVRRAEQHFCEEALLGGPATVPLAAPDPFDLGVLASH